MTKRDYAMIGVGVGVGFLPTLMKAKQNVMVERENSPEWRDAPEWIIHLSTAVIGVGSVVLWPVTASICITDGLSKLS